MHMEGVLNPAWHNVTRKLSCFKTTWNCQKRAPGISLQTKHAPENSCKKVRWKNWAWKILDGDVGLDPCIVRTRNESEISLVYFGCLCFYCFRFVTPASINIRPWQTRTHCCRHIVAHDVSLCTQTGKHLFHKIRNIFGVLDTKFVSATNVARACKRGNIGVGNNPGGGTSL